MIEEFFWAALNWLYLNFPKLFLSFGGIAFILYIIKEIKEIFVDRGVEEESFGIKIKYFFFFWLKKSKKFKHPDPHNIIYDDEDRKNAISTLKKHNFFQEINLIKNNKIISMNFGSKRKNEILKDVIWIYVDVIGENVLNIIKNYQLDKMKTDEINDLFSKEINNTSIQIYSKIRTKIGDDLYNMIIEDPNKGFKVENSIFREIFINGVLNMSVQHMSVYGYDNYERATDILTSMYISLQIIVKNFEKVFKNFNGELDKYL